MQAKIWSDITVCHGGSSGGNAAAWGISVKLYISLTQRREYDKGSVKISKALENFIIYFFVEMNFKIIKYKQKIRKINIKREM